MVAVPSGIDRQQAHYDELTWPQRVERLDRVISDSLRAVLANYGRKAVSTLVAGFNELGKLSEPADEDARSGIPDYKQPGVAAAYAFTYLMHRVSSIAAVLDAQPEQQSVKRILDIGSGADSAGLAWQLLYGAGLRRLVMAEPSREMRRFGERLTAAMCSSNGLLRHGVRRLGVSIEEMCSGKFPSERSFDVIILSACFPYGYRGDREFVAILANLLRPGGLLIAIEPEKKKEILGYLGDLLSDVFATTSEMIKLSSLKSRASERLVLWRTTDLLLEYKSSLSSNDAMTDVGRKLLHKVLDSNVISVHPANDFFLIARRPPFLNESDLARLGV